MNEEEIKEAYKKNELDDIKWLGFDNPKQTLLTYNIIAWLEKKEYYL
jgi:hypothetical protein